MGEAWLAADDWLSGKLGKPAFHIDGEFAAGVPKEIAMRLEQDVLFVDAKVAPGDTARVRALERQGFHLIETSLTLSCRRDAVPDGDGLTIGFATPDMADAVGDIAGREFSFDRFHRDPAISAEVANTIKRDWARNYFTGKRGDWMVVAADGGVPVGFLQLLRTAKDDVVIDLVAVDRQHRGRGWARAMISFAARRCVAAGRMIVGTQQDNLASIRLYESLGFRQEFARCVFHHHGRDQC